MMDFDPKTDETLEEIDRELHEIFLESAHHTDPAQRIRFYGSRQPELTPEQKEESRLALARTHRLVEAENARRAKMTPEEREAEDAEEDRLDEESEAEFEAILAQRDAEEKARRGKLPSCCGPTGASDRQGSDGSSNFSRLKIDSAAKICADALGEEMVGDPQRLRSLVTTSYNVFVLM